MRSRNELNGITQSIAANHYDRFTFPVCFPQVIKSLTRHKGSIKDA